MLLLTQGNTINAQEESDYTAFLHTAPEVSVNDSMRITTNGGEARLLDSSAVKKWFSRLLPSTATNRLKNRKYYLAGKITRNENFDLLVVIEEKKRTDSSNVQVVHLVTTKKDGGYIASLEAAMSGSKRKTNYDISSWLYHDYRIIKDSRIMINEKPYDDFAQFKINNSGRFIMY